MNKRKASIIATVIAVSLIALTVVSYAAWQIMSASEYIQVDPDPIVYAVTMVPPANGTLSDVYTFTGTVTADGTPLAGATVELYIDDVATGLTDNSDGAGHFSITWVPTTTGIYKTNILASGV